MMTIKEKFDSTIMRSFLVRDEIEETKQQCADIAEELAVEFGKWILRNFNSYGNKNETELFLIFKKQNNL